MKKLLILFILIIVIAIVSILFYINANSAEIISNFLSKQMRTHVVVESSSIGFRNISLFDLRILNPSGSSMPDALKVDRVDIEFDPSSLWKETILVSEILIKHPTLGIEFYNLPGSDNNWKSIFDNLAPAPAIKPKKSEKKKKKKVIIDTLVIEDLTIKAQHKMLGPYPITLPAKQRIEFHHLTEDKAVAYRSALNLIFRAILTPISKLKGMQDLLKDTKTPADVLQSTLNNISSQIAPEESTKETISNLNSDWSKFKDDLETGTRNVKEFFKGLKK